MCDGNNVGIPQLLLGRRNFIIALVRKASSDKPGLQSVHLSECCRKKGEAFLAQQTRVWQHQRSPSLTHLHMSCRQLDFGLSSDASICLQSDRVDRERLFFFFQATISHEV